MERKEKVTKTGRPRRTPKKKQYTQADILKAIKGSGGIVSTVAIRLKCEWNTAKKYIEKYEAAKIAISNEEESALDMAESGLLENVKDRDNHAIFYFLNNRGKKRGYNASEDSTANVGTFSVTINPMVNIQKEGSLLSDIANADS